MKDIKEKRENDRKEEMKEGGEK